MLPFAGAAETAEITLSPKVITASVARMLIRILDISLLRLVFARAIYATVCESASFDDDATPMNGG